MRSILVLFLTLPLGGCWFFMVPIPSSLFEGDKACAAESVQVGQKLKMPDGRHAKVEKIDGRHQRCPTGRLPILVGVSYDEAK